jgi:phosphohistidine phosphatase
VLRLTLIRHANADWKDASYEDFDRPLNKRGLAEAESIGKILVENDLIPELMLASTAKRTQQTAEIAGRQLGLASRRLKAMEQLYLAREEAILALVHATGPKVHHLAVIGHNPGISELARSLAPDDAQIGELVTAAACTLTFIVDSWEGLQGPAARAVEYKPAPPLFNIFGS